VGDLTVSFKFALDYSPGCHGTKIWDSTLNSEIIVWSTAKRLNRHRVRQNKAYLVCIRQKSP